MWSTLASLVAGGGYCAGAVLGCVVGGMHGYNATCKDALVAGHTVGSVSGITFASSGYIASKLIIQAATLQPVIFWKTPLLTGMVLSHGVITLFVRYAKK